PYLHIFMAGGVIVWGMYLVRQKKTAEQKSELKTITSKNSSLINRDALLLLIPCPVCLTAMTFSIWSALQVIKWNPVIVGLSLGIVFVVFSLTIYFLIKAFSQRQSSLSQEIRLDYHWALLHCLIICAFKD
ncbi:MAG: DUF2162 domain-containing protein, partial [Thermodesulfovibrionales bacterium]|nr:DUF2162 domain-containing protein [Thermodesulfovibrionales bacterium]